jgi:predicted dehydrogenase
MLNIALIGAGQLGSRHLQGLALLNRPARITVVDPGEKSLATAQGRFAQVKQDKVEARFATRFEELPREIDGAVVATSADVRRKAIEALLGHAKVKVALLEKVLFQRLEDYDAIGRLLHASGTRAWVNCAQRLWPFFAELRARTLGKNNVHIGVSGAQWGLGCNAIHNIDLLPFLTGDQACRIETALDAGTIPSKRPNFIEFTGTLHAHGARGNRVVQTSWRDGDAPFEFEVQGQDFRVLWRVADGAMRMCEAANGWKWREGESRAPYQSQLTHTVLLEMIEQGRSVLPTYAESAKLHRPMLEAFLLHQNRKVDEQQACAIT